MSNEKLQQWALIAEIVAGFGVLVTLIILLIEVRENTEITRITAYQNEITALNEWRDSIASSPEQSRVFAEYGKGNIPEIDSQDGVILRMIFLNVWTQFESAFYSRNAGLLVDAQWSRMERSICFSYRGLSQYPIYWENTEPRMTEEFRDFIADRCSE